MSKQLAVKEDKANLPSGVLDDLVADAGAGMEEVTSSDLTLPFLYIIQSLSPQLKKTAPEYIPGAEVGMLFLSTTRQLFSEVVVIPCYFHNVYLEWKPRNMGGGLVAIHRDESILATTTKNDKNQDMTSQGNEIVKTATFYGMIVNEETGETFPVVIPMKKTQLKKAKNWNTLISNKKLKNPANGSLLQKPAFSHSYKMTTISESNNQGEWSSFVIQDYKPTHELSEGSHLYQVAKMLYENARQGNVKTADFENDDLADSAIDASSVM